jgi:hypothetical protein
MLRSTLIFFKFLQANFTFNVQERPIPLRDSVDLYSYNQVGSRVFATREHFHALRFSFLAL